MTFWSHSTLTARKPHVCSMCGRRIDAGEKYMKGAGMDGTAWTWKECFHCKSFRQLTDIGFDGEYNEDTFADMEPLDGLEETWLRQYRRRWRTSQGSLFPIPTRAAVEA